MNRKGQAAMEFLMTYGWAILVVLIAIGALAYFGVLNPAQFLPESCTLGPGLSCDDFKIIEDGTTTLIIRNGMGEDLSAVTVTMEAACVPAATTIADGDTTTFTCAGTAGTAGSKYKSDITFAYTGAGAGALAHSKTGTLTTKYE